MAPTFCSESEKNILEARQKSYFGAQKTCMIWARINPLCDTTPKIRDDFFDKPIESKENVYIEVANKNRIRLRTAIGCRVRRGVWEQRGEILEQDLFEN